MRSTLSVMALCAMTVFASACQKAEQTTIVTVGPTGPSLLAECSDGRNNDPDEDDHVDARDPGCHHNNDLNQPYDPNDNSERNGGGGPPAGFGLNAPMSCVLANGEYHVSFGWLPSVMGGYRVEYKSSRDGVWRSATELFQSSVQGTTFTAHRVRADYSHSFRVWSGNTLWNTPEEQATCAKVPACRDMGDNDGDGLIDFPGDPGCSSRDDDDEFNAPPPTSTPGPGPGPGGPTGPTGPTTGGSCSGSSAALPDLTARGQTRGFAISAPAGCAWTLTSNNHHVVSVNPSTGTGPSSGSVTSLNAGTATICFTGSGACRTYTIP